MAAVYLITCANTGATYIGQSAYPDMRWKTHLRKLNQGIHKNKALQAAWNMSSESFTFTILEECSWDDAITRERYYISVLKPTCNARIRSVTRKSHRLSQYCVRAYSIEKAQEDYIRSIARARKMPESMVIREAIDLYRESNESEATA